MKENLIHFTHTSSYQIMISNSDEKSIFHHFSQSRENFIKFGTTSTTIIVVCGYLISKLDQTVYSVHIVQLYIIRDIILIISRATGSKMVVFISWLTSRFRERVLSCLQARTAACSLYRPRDG